MTREDLFSMIMGWLDRPANPISEEFARWVWWQGFLDTVFGVVLLAGGVLVVRHLIDRDDLPSGVFAWLGIAAAALGAWFLFDGVYALAMHQVAERVSVLEYALQLLD